MSQPERIFIGWDKPLAAAVAAKILDERTQRKGTADGVIDLGDQLVIAPSAFAGRMIQEALAAQAGALLLPRIVTPSLFLSQQEGDSVDPDRADDTEEASREAMLLAWIAALTDGEFKREAYPSLFHSSQKGPMPADGARAFALDLMLLRDELGATAGGINFREMSLHPVVKSEGLPDNLTKRWADMAKIEELYAKKLGRLVDHNNRRRENAASDKIPAGIEGIWLAGVIDPQPLLITALQNRLANVPVRVLIAADEAEDAAAFTAWGAPDRQSWSKPRGRAWPDFAERVHVVNKTEDGLEALCRLVSEAHTKVDAQGKAIIENGQPVIETAGRLSAAPCDREAHPIAITRALHALGRAKEGKPLVETANPLGRPHREHGIHHAMLALLDFVENPTFRNLRRCANLPEVAKQLGLAAIKMPTGADGEEKRAIGWHGMQGLLDTVSAAKPPQDLADVIAFAKARRTEPSMESHELRRNTDILKAAEVLQAAKEAADSLSGLGWLELGLGLLSLCQPKDKNLDDEEWRFAEDVSGAIEMALQALADGKPERTTLTRFDIVRIALETAGNRAYRANMDRKAVNLPGWMEIPWEPVPHLIIFGLNDELVPGSRHAHAFLPASLREKLGLSTPEQQFANAAYTLELARRQRAATGRVDIIVPLHNDDHEGLRPSRLLMLSPEKDKDTLISADGKSGRLAHLLAAPTNSPDMPYWQIPQAHLLDPTLPLPEDKGKADEKTGRFRNRIRATAFKTYLANPAEFWLKQALGMSSSSHDGLELDPAAFGTMIHAALEAFGREEVARGQAVKFEGDWGLSDAGEIRRALETKLIEHFTAQFGKKADGALLLQLEVARARLEKIAGFQAAERKKGWCIREVEGPLPEIKLGETGVVLHGRFDRLDYNTETKAFRVYDYKTFSKRKAPNQTHLYTRQTKRGIELGDFPKPGTKAEENKRWRWKDLQLPAYYWSLRNGHALAKGQTIELAYVVISPEPKDNPLAVWTEFDGYLADEAWKCMLKVAAAVHDPGHAFAPAAIMSDYPLLPGLSGRAPQTYMDVNKLGKTEVLK